jgi:hypothetical protein
MRILGYLAFGGVHTIQRVSLHQGTKAPNNGSVLLLNMSQVVLAL